MGCCLAKEENKNIIADSNINLEDGTKKQDNNNKVSVETVFLFFNQNVQAPKETPQLEEHSIVKDSSSFKNGKKKKKTAKGGGKIIIRNRINYG